MHYYLTASNGKGHGIHSPFIYRFIRDVLNDHNHYYAYDDIEALRESLRKNHTILTIEDFGAGSSLVKSNARSISSILRNSVKSAKYGQLMHRLVNYYQCNRIIELGTSLGITTAYLASANIKGEVITIEGSSAVALQALKNFRALGLTNIEVITGRFDSELPYLVDRFKNFDLAFIDGNHRFDATLHYFNYFKSIAKNESMVVFDDINWSKEMKASWEHIIKDDAVTASVDLFFLGIVFFRKDFKAKQHFSVRF